MNPHTQGSLIKNKRTLLRWRNQLCWGLVIIFLSLNILAYLLSYQMTHIQNPGQTGIGLPKPRNNITPSEYGLLFKTLIIPTSDGELLEAWEISASKSNSRGTILLFPGNLGTKGKQLIGPSQSFVELGFDTLLIDFQGVGGSSGNTNTIGMKESEDVVNVFNYLKEKKIQEGNQKSPIILYGVSMGTAAILRAISVNNIAPDAIILELPFIRLLQTIRSRLIYQNIPPFPLAELLVFWGGIQHGFNAFAHNPINYAKDVDCPTLLIHGEQVHEVRSQKCEVRSEKLVGDCDPPLIFKPLK